MNTVYVEENAVRNVLLVGKSAADWLASGPGIGWLGGVGYKFQR